MMLEKRSATDGVSQIISGISSLMSGGQNNQGFDMIGTILSAMTANDNVGRRSARDTEHDEEGGIDWGNIINMGSMFLQQKANNDILMGLVPLVLETLGHGTKDGHVQSTDHSAHSWFLPPILENIHVMWEHFRYCDETTWIYKVLQDVFSKTWRNKNVSNKIYRALKEKIRDDLEF